MGRYIYRTTVKWAGERKGRLFSAGKPEFEVASPPEFRGHVGVWTPEELFISAVNSCVMTTFLYYIDKGKLELKEYESECEGILEQVDEQFIFTEIVVGPKIVVKYEADIKKAKRFIELAEKHCLISNSIKTQVKVIPEMRFLTK